MSWSFTLDDAFTGLNALTDDLFGPFSQVGSDLGPLDAFIGFGYDLGGSGGGTSFGYLNTTGSYRVERLAVPLPGTLPLLALGLLGLVGQAARRRGVTAPAARGSR